eukprot:comp12449_c0_seq1/m.7376 comp12449_c0_seq1/g.7376  ORF comp12449_c0_seq1/g.7376 comp12449_c0_seq1/m.7376 type:complete len:784 (-) comp12449_c0_seq1:710-3061(-)
MEEEAGQNPHTALIQELCSSDAQLAPTLRAVYDSGQHDSFLDSINKYIAKTDTEIEKLCNFHYQGFIEAVDELLKVRKDGVLLKDELQEIDHELMESGKGVLGLAEDLVAHRVMQKNIVASVEALNACLPVLQLYGKVTEHVAAKRYYQALRTLTQLQSQLPKVAGLGLTQLLVDNIPTVREAIKMAVRSDLQDWLEGVIAQATGMGQTVLRETAKEIWEDRSKIKELFGSTDGSVDYAPVYHSLHIYTVLGKRDEFVMFYVDSRKKQATLVLDSTGPTTSNISNPFDRILHYFCQVVGFFIVEDHILNTTQHLVSPSSVDDLWKMALDRIGSTLSRELSACREKATLLELKKIVVLFCVTLAGYGYNTARLYDLLLNVRDRYDQLLMSQWQERFDIILVDDDYKPLKVDTPQQWEAIMSKYEYYERAQEEKIKYPRNLPYSRSVLELFKAIRDFYPASRSFVEDLNLSHTQVDEMIRASGNRLIAKHLCLSLNSMVTQAVEDTSVTTLVQLVVNTTILQTILPQLDQYIAKLTNTTATGYGEQAGSGAQGAGMAGVATLQEVRKRAEDCTVKLLQTVIDKHIGYAKYNWVPEVPQTTPSEYIQSLVQYLTSLFARLEHLPPNVTSMAYFSACNYLANRLLSMIAELPISGKGTVPTTRTTVPNRMNLNVFAALDLDVMMCEGFAVSCVVPHLRECFRQVRELIDLFKENNFPEYLNAKTRQAKYKSIQIHNVVAVMDRLLVDDGSRTFSKFFGGDKDRRRMEQFMTDLKTLQAQMRGQQGPQ